MIPVYICEDEPYQLKILMKIVSEAIKAEGFTEMKIACAAKDPLEIIERINSNTLSLYFLDVDLGDNKMSGLELAVKIREQNVNAHIVMITAYDFALDTYRLRIGVKDYIIKGNPETMAIRIAECLKDLYNAAKTLEADNCSYLKVNDSYKINVDEIYCISTKPGEKRKVVILKKVEVSTMPISLKEIMYQNNAALFQCDRSHMININYVNIIDSDNKCAILENGLKVPVSRRRIKLLERKISFLHSK